jgi:drug/metabolite transporter (DMT)-like permease
MSRLTKGYLIALVATAFWSTTGVFIRYLTETYRLPPLVLAFWRELFVCTALAAALALVAPSRLRVDRRHLWFLFAYGFVLSIFNSLWTVSVALNGAAVATVLAYGSPAITAIAGWRLFGERLDSVKVVAVVLGVIGCTFVSGAYTPSAWQVNPWGITTGLLAAVTYAGYSLMGKAAAHRQIYPWTSLLYTFAFAAPFLLVYNVVPGWLPGVPKSPSLMWLGSSWVGWGVLVALAVGPTIGGYGLYAVSLTYLPASVANLIATLEPSMTAVLAYLFLHETFTTPQLIGSGLIIGGVIILRIGEGRAPSPAEDLQPAAPA